MVSTQFAALKDVADAQFGLITHTQLHALGFPAAGSGTASNPVDGKLCSTVSIR